ncbi:CPBP family intramembrane glutamic endopeptidase [Propionibacteriaceae bacterium Y1700]|uniref:CPBP family intramembrane glutamic endopeptidase n=1 Tax=Microlunatus sp. Y1700 TaxID=3418487 RepID=UPI003DA70036
MPGIRLRTVASHATAITHAWPRWAPLAVFALALAVVTAALCLLQGAIGPDPELIGLHRFAPAVAVGLLYVVFAGHHHGPSLATDRGLGWRTAAIALFTAALGVAIVVTAMASHEIITGGRVGVLAVAYPIPLLLAVQIIGALGEETAWRAYLQPELEQWWHPLPAAIGVGLAWGIWQSLVLHPPLTQAAVITVTAIALSVALRATLQFTGGNYLLVATVFRTVIGFGLLLALPTLDDDRVAQWSLGGAAVTVATVTWVVSTWRPSGPRTNDAVSTTPTGTAGDWTAEWGWSGEQDPDED